MARLQMISERWLAFLNHRFEDFDLFTAFNCGIETAAAACVACRALLIDFDQDAVPVTVDLKVNERLSMATGGPLDPKLLTGAGPIGHLSRLQRSLNAFCIHPRHHQDFP